MRCACVRWRTQNPLCHITCQHTSIFFIYKKNNLRCFTENFIHFAEVDVDIIWYGLLLMCIHTVLYAVQWNGRVWIVACSCHKFAVENYSILLVPWSLWAASCYYLSDLHFAGVCVCEKQNRKDEGKHTHMRMECGRIDIFRILKEFIYYGPCLWYIKRYWFGLYFMRSLKDLSACRTVCNAIASSMNATMCLFSPVPFGIFFVESATKRTFHHQGKPKCE